MKSTESVTLLEKRFEILCDKENETLDDAMALYGTILLLSDTEGEEGLRKTVIEAGRYKTNADKNELDGLISRAKVLMKKYPELV